MRILLFSFILLISSSRAYAQIGISGQFLSYPLTNEEELYQTNFYDASFGFAIDYWARLKNYRWETVPTFSANFAPSVISPRTSPGVELSMWAAKFHVKNNIYLFDFVDDCDCPTFSKDGGWFQKSFFLQVSPGVAFHRISAKHETTPANITPIDVNDNRWQGELGLGAGFDLGISDLVTLSPYFNYVFTTRTSADLIPGLTTDERFSTNHFLVGIRLGLRPDYARPSSRRRRALGY